MISKLLVSRLANQNGSDFLASLRTDNWVGSNFAIAPEPQAIVTPGPVNIASPAWSLASGSFTQNWSNTGLITVNDDWSGVPAIVGFRTGDVTSATGVDARTITTDAGFVAQVLANQAATAVSGGILEVETGTALGSPANTTIAMQGANGNDYAAIVIYLDSSSRQDVRLTANIRDIDSGTDNAIQQVVVQYRVGSSGAWTNVTGGYFADVTTVSATPVTAVDLTLPTDANNVSDLQIRILTTNAAGNDELVGIDDIVVSSNAIAGGESQTVQFNPTSVTHAEGDSGTTAYTFTITRTGGTTGQLDFSGTIAAGTTDNADYVGGTAPTTFSGSILAGQASATITVNVAGDLTVEGDESFTLALTTATNGAAGVTTAIGAASGATGNITNDDLPGSFSIGDVTLAEGNAGNTAFTFTVTRTGGSDGAVGATWTLNAPGGAGNADAGDFDAGQPLSGTVSFADGETSQTITIQVKGDAVVEPDEGFTVTLSAPTGSATITDGSGAGTITNDDSPPVATIGDAAVVEGDDGVTYLVFTVTLDHGSNGTVTYDYASSDGTAIAASDYVAVSGQISFAPGETSQTISIPVIGDDAPENNEMLTVTLSNPVGGSIGDGAAAGTITNDDGSSYYSLAAGSFTQNWTNTGQITANDDWSGVPYIVGYLGDIDPSGATTNIDPRTLTGANLGAIDVIANLTTTTNTSGGVGEFFKVDATDNVDLENPTIALQGSGTADAPSLVLYMDASGRSGVRLQANLRDIDFGDNSAQQVNVQYRTDPNGAWTNVPGGYFADTTTGPSSASQVTALDVTLPAGADNAATLEIRIMTTNAAGNDEWIGIDDIVVSSQQSGPSLSIGNTAIFEADSGATLMTFTVTRAGDPTGAVTADYNVNLGSGPFDANSSDFTPATPLSGQVSFADGQTTATITVSVNGDTGAEGDERFTVTLSNASGATINDGTATGTIVNDDGQPPLVTIDDVTVTEGNSGTSLMTFTVTRTGGTGAFDVDYQTADGSATAGSDYVATSGTLHFADGQTTQQISVTINGDTDAELAETLQVNLSNPTNFAVVTDPTGIGTIAADDPIYIHMIQGDSYFSPILAAEGIHNFNTASAGLFTVRAIVTAVDDDGPRQGFYIQEEVTDWDANPFTSEGIFVFTGATVSGVAVGDLVTVTAHVMEFQGFAANMPVTTLTSPTSIVVNSTGNTLPAFTLGSMPTAIMTGVTPDYTDSADGAGDSFDASLYALSFWETVEGMLVTLPDVTVADGFVTTSGGQPIFQAYSASLTDADQINSRGGLTIAGDPPIGPPDTLTTVDDTTNGGRAATDGDMNPDIIEIDFSGFAIDAPAGLTNSLSMGDYLGSVTGIVDFDFTDRKLFVTGINPGSFVDHTTTQETTSLGGDDRALTFGAFNVENLDPTDPIAKFQGLAQAIATNLHMPDIVSIEEIQDNNGAAAGDGTSPTGTDASTTWQMLVDALNTLTGAHYQWVDELPTYNAEGGEQSGNIRVGFLYNTDRVQLGDLDANATIQERRMYTDRIGDGLRDAGDLIAYSDNMLGSEIQTSDWAGTRRSLLGQFTFHGNTVFITANHFPAKGGSDDFWEFNQNPAGGEPTNSGWTQRNAVAQDVYSMLNLIDTNSPGAGIVSGGDYNDFYFYRPLTTVTGYTMADGTARVGGARFHNLTLTLNEAERYTYNFDGRSQAIDHIIVNDTLSAVATYDVVHLNTGFNTNDPIPLSDHDPGLSSFDFRSMSETLSGTGGDDLIDLSQGGNDTVDGGAGNDGFFFGAQFTAADHVDGGAGMNDQIGLKGDYTGVNALTLGANTITNVEAIVVLPGFSYDITTVDGNVAAGGLLYVQATQLAAGESLHFNGSAETDGAFRIFGGQGNDNFTGGAGNDGFYFGPGGFNSSDVLNGGGGANDQLGLDGDYTITLGGNLSNIEAIVLLHGPSATPNHFNITAANSLVAAGATMTIFGLQVETGIQFNGTAETDGAFRIYGGTAGDFLRGGNGADWIFGGNGGDTLDGAGGNDIFYYDDVAQSTTTSYDVIMSFLLGDKIDVSGIDAIAGGSDDAFSFLGAGAFTGHAGELRAFNDAFMPFAWTIQGDIDGDGNADFQIALMASDSHTLGTADFTF